MTGKVSVEYCRHSINRVTHFKAGNDRDMSDYVCHDCGRQFLIGDIVITKTARHLRIYYCPKCFNRSSRTE